MAGVSGSIKGSRGPSGAWRLVAIVALLVLVAGCGGAGTEKTAKAGSSDEPAKSKAFDPARGVVLGSAGEGAGEQLCAAFSAKRIAGFVPAKLERGEVTGPLGSACTWTADGGNHQVQIQAVPADMYQPPSLAEGYEEVEGVADEAALTPDGEGYQAWARVGDRATVVVATDAGKNHREEALALLREVLKVAFP